MTDDADAQQKGGTLPMGSTPQRADAPAAGRTQMAPQATPDVPAQPGPAPPVQQPVYVPAEPPGVAMPQLGAPPAAAPGMPPAAAPGMPPAAAPVAPPAAAPVAPPAGAPGAPPAAAPGMPPMPAGAARADELMTDGPRTVFEFSGEAAEQGPPGSRHTFSGEASIDMGRVEARPHNLGSSGPTWLLVGVAVLVVGGALAFMVGRQPPAELEGEAAGSGETVVSPAGVTTKDGAKETGVPADAKADETKAGETKADAKADETKADETKADETKADEPKKDEPKKDEPKKDAPKKDEPKKDEPKKPAPKPKKKKPAKKKATVIKPKKPPRDDGYGNLPKPPGG